MTSEMTDTAPRDRGGYLCRLAEMLATVFRDARYTPAYLEWQYDQSPEGAEIAIDILSGDDVVAHYCLVPQTWTDGRTELNLASSLNTAVSARARGKGVFTRLAQETYARAAGAFGIEAIVGVSNASSTPGFVRRLDFALVTPLPVRLGLGNPFVGGGERWWRIDPGQALPAELAAMMTDLPTRRDGLLRQVWTVEKLAWRLRSPLGPFWVHVCDDGILVSRIVRAAGLPIVVPMKFLARHARPPIPARRLIDAACRTHRTPLFLYVGTGVDVRLAGLPLPRRLLPSPLNLIYLRLGGRAPIAEELHFGSFEFLDWDAY